MCWATFWAIFSQTHLVTLMPEYIGFEMEQFPFFKVVPKSIQFVKQS
jgi:hypothetical protein